MNKIRCFIICLCVIFASCGSHDDDVFLRDVKISKQPDKLSYYIGEELDITGLEVTKVFSDGKTEVIRLSKTDFSGFDSSVANEKLRVHAIVEGKRIEFTVKIIEANLVSVKINALPTKIKYTLDEKLDLSGIQVIGEYSNGNEKRIEITAENVSGFNSKVPVVNQELRIKIDKFTKSFKVEILPIRVTDGVLVEFVGESTELVLPSNVKSIARDVFKENKTISKIVLNNGLNSIGKYAFYDCSSLSSINFPSSLMNIGKGAFYYCNKLSNVDLSSTKLEHIEENAFSVCRGLESLKLPETLKTIEDQAFLETGNISEVKIPESVVSVGLEAFRESKIQKVQINNGIETLGTRCFYHCKSLAEVSIHGKVTSNQNDICKIKNSSFEGCSELSKFKMPLSITHIGQSILIGTNVTELELGERIKDIDFSAFGYAEKLKKVSIKAIEPPVSDYYAFPKDIDYIKVPAASVDKYKNANFWKDFSSKIQPIK